MEAFRAVATITFPNYLKKLPIPKTFGGFANLTGEQWLHILPFFTTSLLILIALLNLLLPERKRSPMVNKDIKKKESKVADVMDIEDLGDKEAFCRCWRSKKFPYCDGSHNRHNEDTGDNVGPLVLKKTSKKDK